MSNLDTALAAPLDTDVGYAPIDTWKEVTGPKSMKTKPDAPVVDKLSTPPGCYGDYVAWRDMSIVVCTDCQWYEPCINLMVRQRGYI